MKKYVDYAGAGVYVIINERSNKQYIGSSKNINKRIQDHINQLRVGNHRNKDLQDDFNNGDTFRFEVMKKMICDLHEELLSNEKQIIDDAKRQGIDLYNRLDMNGSYYAMECNIMKYMANEYCKEKLGMPINQLLNKCKAEYTMIFQILLNPDKEQEIREKFEPAIDYQNKSRFYEQRFRMSYEQFLELPQDKQKELTKSLRRK